MDEEANKTNSLSEMDYICKMMVELLKTSIRYMDGQGHIAVEYAHGSNRSLFINDQLELLQKLAKFGEFAEVPVIQTTEFDENYLVVNLTAIDGINVRCQCTGRASANVDCGSPANPPCPLPTATKENKSSGCHLTYSLASPPWTPTTTMEASNKTYLGCFILGPCLYCAPEEEKIAGLMRDHQLPLSQKKLIMDYYRSLTVIDYVRLVNAGLLIHYLLYGVQLDAGTVITQSSRLSGVMEHIDAKFRADLSQNKQYIHFHHSQLMEQKICECIKAGDTTRLMNYVEFPQDGEAGVLSKKDALRSRKNLMICMITIITRAAIEGGLDTESAFTLSDLYIQQLEELTVLGDVDTFMAKAALDLANRVRRVRKSRYSANVSKCTHYISQHLYDEIHLQALAELVGLHPNYLSTLLKKELGMSLVNYVQQERIEEAKRLLSDTAYSLPEIAAWLNFHDQSHFTRIFKAHTGTTPKKFRK